MAARIATLVAILLFQILENYNLNKVTVIEDLLPHKISGCTLSGASVTPTSDELNILVLLKIQNRIRDGTTYNGMSLTSSSLNFHVVEKLFVEIAT